MKKILLLFCIVISWLLSCNSTANQNNISKDSTAFNKLKPQNDTDIIKEKVAGYIKDSANDPSSYKPISTTLEDTLTYQKYLQDEISVAIMFVQVDKKLSEPPAKLSEDQNHLDSLTHIIDSLNNSNNPDAPMKYIFYHKCIIKSGFGVPSLTTLKVTTDTKLNVLKIEEEK